MPLRDHFRPPLSESRSWEGFHGGWPMKIVEDLMPRLPDRYIAEPQVHLGRSVEVDVATFAEDDAGGRGNGRGGGAVAAAWAPPMPTWAAVAELPDPDEHGVRFYDAGRGRRLVASIELVSPANKDRPEHRRAFVAKCAAMLGARASVAIVDVVTDRSANLYADLLDALGLPGPAAGDELPSTYATACRPTRRGEGWSLETWAYPLAVGRELPTLPLWIAEGVAIPLDLAASYEATCRILRIP